MVAENAQYWPEVLTVRDLIDDGAIGEVVTARAATFFPALGDFYGGDRPWRFDRAAAGGGVVIDTGSHWLRPLRDMAGRGRRGRRRARPPAPATWRASRCAARCCGSSRARSRRSTRCSTTGAHRDPAAVHRHRHDRRADGRGLGLGEAVGRHRLEGHARWASRAATCSRTKRELADFAPAVLHGTPPAAPAEYALGELRLALAMYRSARDEPLGEGVGVTGATFDFGGAHVLVTGGTSGIGLRDRARVRATRART